MRNAVLVLIALMPTRLLAANDESRITALTAAFYQAVSMGDRDKLSSLLVRGQTTHCGTVAEAGPVTPRDVHLDIKSDIAWVTLTEQRIDGTRRATLILQKIDGEWKIFAQL